MKKELLTNPINLTEAQEITDFVEKTFALACLESGCTVYHQVPVGDSVIDFLIINPRNPSSTGKLVEVTFAKKDDINKKYVIKKTKKKKKRKLVNFTGQRKQRQINNMKDDGRPWTILYQREMQNINRHKLNNQV